jgi:hypothetical protein
VGLWVRDIEILPAALHNAKKPHEAACGLCSFCTTFLFAISQTLFFSCHSLKCMVPFLRLLSFHPRLSHSPAQFLRFSHVDLIRNLFSSYSCAHARLFFLHCSKVMSFLGSKLLLVIDLDVPDFLFSPPSKLPNFSFVILPTFPSFLAALILSHHVFLLF